MALYLTIGIIVIGIFLFVKEFFTVDTTSLLIMALFITSGVLSPNEGFSGFIHPATLVLGCMFVISAAVVKTGLIDGISKKIIRLAKIHYMVALVLLCLFTAVFSAFTNDAAVVAIMIPITLEVCRTTNIAPSKLLIPVSFAACFGGACTLIGTGTNILISGYAESRGLASFNMFEFTQPALILSLIGMVYLFLIAPLLLPKRANSEFNTLEKEAEHYTAGIIIEDECPDIDKQIRNSKLNNEFKVQVLTINRGDQTLRTARELTQDTVLKKGDKLKILISPTSLNQLKNTVGYSIIGDSPKQLDLPKDNQLYEVMIPFGSGVAGKSLKALNFRNRYQCSVLAIRHRSATIMQDLPEIILKEGDMMLIYCSKKSISRLTQNKMVVTLSEHESKKIDYKKAIPVLLIAIGVVMAAALNLTNILMSGMIGCLLLVTTSLLKPDEAYDAIDWKVIFMMAGVLSMGSALEKSGGSVLVAELIYSQLGNIDPRITMSAVFLITFLSTNILSSRASAALMTPIVISLAETLQVSERPFLVATMFACAFTFMTPMCNPTNTMVYAAGNYKFNDYIKVGTPLNIIIWIAASFIIPLFFPF